LQRILKQFLRFSLAPVIRGLRPLLESARRLRAYVHLSASVSAPVDPSVVVLGRIEVRGTGQIRLGRDVLLYPDLYLETEESGSIRVEDGVVISRGVHIASRHGVTIGAGSMIGEYSSIRDSNHSRAPGAGLRESGYAGAPITIGRQVWIGRGVAILPGVEIGEGATIGANAVVTKNVLSGSVVVGVPAHPTAKHMSRNRTTPQSA